MEWLRWALESAAEADGKMVKEVEHVFYAQLTDFGQLGRAMSIEHQEQWEIKIEHGPDNGAKGKVRVRAIRMDNAEKWEYVLAVKASRGGDDHFEVEVPTTADMMAAMKFLAPSGMIKDRYCFPVVGTSIVFEVDVFKKPDGEYFDWVKIDVEVDDKDEPLPIFPLEFKRIIMEQNDKRSDEDEALVRSLYEEVFITKNQYAKGGA